ncbi:hypothetical protein LCGC14_2715290, partial [marine sediment metagenome]
MPRTIRQIRHSIARRFNDLWVGTLTSEAASGTSTLADTARVEAANWFINAYVYVDEDAAGEEHRISASAVGSLTIPSTLAATHAIGKKYEIHKLASMTDYNDFILQALKLASTEAVLTNLDYQSGPGIVFVEGQFEYAIPTNFRYISEVWMDDSADEFTRNIPLSDLSIVPGTQLKLKFPRWMSLTTGGKARVLGQGVDTLPANDD